jgi:hypothetical protein
MEQHMAVCELLRAEQLAHEPGEPEFQYVPQIRQTHQQQIPQTAP